MGMTNTYLNTLIEAKQRRQQAGLHRQRRVVSAHDTMLSFSSNDYLSLSMYQPVRLAFQDAFVNEPIGSGGSMMVCGYHTAHRDLERAFADALQVDACVLFSSGYAANVCIVSLLETLQPIVFVDKSVHASVYDGLKLAHIPFKRFLHNDVADLERKISAPLKITTESFRPIIMTESVFSMSGQEAPLNTLHQLAFAHQAALLVDEAHAFGVFGDQGLGALIDAGLTQNEVPLRMIPFGKSLGASGAIVAGHAEWIDALLQTRPAIYSTSISPAYARGVQHTFEVMRAADDRRAWLKQLIAYFRLQIQQSPLQWRNSKTPIQQLQLGCPHRASALTDFLWQQQIVCLSMRQPTVARDETGLRVILNYHHQLEHIDKLFQAIHRFCV